LLLSDWPPRAKLYTDAAAASAIRTPPCLEYGMWKRQSVCYKEVTPADADKYSWDVPTDDERKIASIESRLNTGITEL